MFEFARKNHTVGFNDSEFDSEKDLQLSVYMDKLLDNFGLQWFDEINQKIRTLPKPSWTNHSIVVTFTSTINKRKKRLEPTYTTLFQDVDSSNVNFNMDVTKLI